MKNIVLAIAALTTFSGGAMAQERQVYPADPSIAYIIPMPLQQAQQPVYVETPQYRVYPGREEYGNNFGPLPRHPGDYRDAVDRGSWSTGQPRYDFNGPHLFYDR